MSVSNDMSDNFLLVFRRSGWGIDSHCSVTTTLRGIVARRSGAGIQTFGPVDPLVPMETARNLHQIGPKEDK
jgi:hypothetical protein